MAFEKGREKTGGRQKGIPNKTTSEMRKELKIVLQDEIRNIPALLNEIDCAEKRLSFTIKLIPFVFPKIRPVYQMEGEEQIFEFGKHDGY